MERHSRASGNQLEAKMFLLDPRLAHAWMTILLYYDHDIPRLAGKS